MKLTVLHIAPENKAQCEVSIFRKTGFEWRKYVVIEAASDFQLLSASARSRRSAHAQQMSEIGFFC